MGSKRRVVIITDAQSLAHITCTGVSFPNLLTKLKKSTYKDQYLSFTEKLFLHVTQSIQQNSRFWDDRIKI